MQKLHENYSAKQSDDGKTLKYMTERHILFVVRFRKINRGNVWGTWRIVIYGTNLRFPGNNKYKKRGDKRNTGIKWCAKRGPNGSLYHRDGWHNQENGKCPKEIK